MELNFNDFQRQDVKFDINKLQKAYKEILKIKNNQSHQCQESIDIHWIDCAPM